MEKQDERKEEEKKLDFNSLPKGSISSILSLTSRRDACRSCLVSSVFKSAAESDVVWEFFLPSDYRDIIARSSSSPTDSSTATATLGKKELYYRLCNKPLLIDGGQLCTREMEWEGMLHDRSKGPLNYTGMHNLSTGGGENSMDPGLPRWLNCYLFVGSN